ncbi:hypothetical protein [Paenibacillus spongiae]|uniref:Uncharacterized protein n=1 Tax=Paenibacillus spongiae TaxID=2909671 RepID=A0ABY5SCW3_9BACL|nr:hypothetical protein [Paenibacillus spongiae]UVI31370.1 hypothetical protein L1F29_05975 [Paenibacillus spongiae]
MEPIPLQEEHIHNFRGMPVCIVTKDGNRHVGIITSCRDGRVYLNEGYGEDETGPVTSEYQGEKPYLQGKESRKGRKSGKNLSVKKAEKAETKAFPFNPFFPFGRAFAIDLALIAFLFLLI